LSLIDVLIGTKCLWLSLFYFWIHTSFVKVKFILQCHKFLVVSFIVDLVAWFWFWVHLIFLFLKLWCLLYFHIWVHTCVLVPYKFFSYNFHCAFEVSLLFTNSSLGLLCFHCYCAGWNLSQKLILWVKNSEILDLSSFICW